MTGQFDIYGVFLPSFAAQVLWAYLVLRALVWALDQIGFYRVVWHRPLFNLALYVTALGGLSFSIRWFSI